MRVFLTLPAYNEEASLPELLANYEREIYPLGNTGKIVIVDDGSSDGTMNVIQDWSSRLPIEVVRHRENCGLGETIRDGLQHAAELARPDDVVVTMDADNTHPVGIIPEMLRRIADGFDVVIASRYRPGAKVVGLSPFRHLMSFGVRVLFQAAFPIPGVRDYSCGFRAYRAGALKQAWAHYGGRLVTEGSFACMAEILLKLRRMGLRMDEVPMVLRYDQKRGESKIRILQTVFRTLRLMAKSRLAA